MSEQPPVCWKLPWPDRSKPAAGYPVLEGVEHFELFRATPEVGVYSHHSQIAHHGGVFYASWSNQREGEDGPGQRVFGALSADGRAWSEWFEICAALGKVGHPEGTGRVATANGWVVADGAAYAVIEVNDSIGFRDEAGTVLREKRSKDARFRARRGLGRLARSVGPQGELGPLFWLLDDPPEPVNGKPQWPDLRDAEFAEVGRRIVQELARPLNSPAWEFKDGSCWTVAADGHRQCEPTCYRRPDGVLVKLSRDLRMSHRMYASLSRDEGRTWTMPVQTDIPDSASKSVSGTLPDGRIYLIGNQVTAAQGEEEPHHYNRDPLVLSLSEDGVTFDRAWAIRHGAPPIRLPGPGKGGGFQYPSAVIVGDALWIIHSIGKEDVAVSRVPLAALSRKEAR